MKLTIFLPLSFALILTARAQTFQPVAMTATNAVAITNPPVAMVTNGSRNITLEECISLALEKNLDLRIQRYNPQLSVFDLSIARGTIYDPLLTATGQHERERMRGLVDSTSGSNIPPAVANSDSLTASLGGSLPWGMSYSLDTTLKESSGDSWGFDTSSTSFTNSPFQSAQGSSVSATLTQPLLRDLWTDKYRVAIAVKKNRVKYSEQGLRQQIITTVSSVENAYYELIFAQENVQVQEESLKLAEQLFQENKKRVEVGVLAPLDEKQAESQMATSRAALLATQRTLEMQENTLKSLITDDYAHWHDLYLQPSEPLVAAKQFFNLQDSWSRGLNNRPDLLQFKLDLEQAGINLKYFRNQILPQLDVTGTYGRNGGGSGLNDALTQFRNENDNYYKAGITFSIPLGNVVARNTYKQGKVTVEQAVLTLKKSEQSVMVEIDEAIKQAQSSFEQVDATRQAREFAEAALDAEQKKLENGKSTSFNVLSLQSALTTARSAEIRALADYNEALTALAQNEGSTLERRKIDVKVK